MLMIFLTRLPWCVGERAAFVRKALAWAKVWCKKRGDEFTPCRTHTQTHPCIRYVSTYWYIYAAHAMACLMSQNHIRARVTCHAIVAR